MTTGEMGIKQAIPTRLFLTLTLIAIAPHAVRAEEPPLWPFALHRIEASSPGPSSAPAEAIRALEQGRFFHASLMLREYLANTRTPSSSDILLAARAEAGWGDWGRVEDLLGNRNWLDTLDNGLGRSLLGRSLFELGKWTRSSQELGRYLENAGTSDRDRGLAEFYRGQAANKAGNAIEAMAAWDRAGALLPAVSDWITLGLVEAAADRGDTATVNARLAGMDAEMARELGWQYRVRAHRKAADEKGAIAAVNNAVNVIRSSSRKASAFVEMGRIRNELGDLDGARVAFRRAIETSGGSTAGVDGARYLSDLKGLTPEDQLLIGRTYLRHGNADRGVAGLKAWLDAGRGTATERERVRLEMGNAYFRAGKYDDAERILAGVVERGISEAIAAEALFVMARSQYRSGRTAVGRRTFMQVAERYPGSETAARAMFMAADLNHDDGELDQAIRRYRGATTMSPDAEEVGLAHMRLGGLAFVDGDWAAARDEFDGYRRRYPNGRRYIQATYWSALSSRKLGDAAAADDRLREVLRLDPLSYYGSRARELLGTSFWDLPLRTAPVTDPALAADVKGALDTVDLLLRLERTDAAAWEVDRIRERFAASRTATYALAEALNERGFTMTGIAIGWDLFRRDGGWNDRLLRIIYPFPFRAIIMAEAAERDVDPFLAAGLIRQESMFNIGAVSGAGAIGLMQVMPATGQALARQLGVREFDADMLKHAELNAHLGMNYLSEQLADFGGRLPVVLAAYNAGPHRIVRWSEFPEFKDDEQFSERIPFGETRDYVKIVQSNADIYRALYGASPAVSH